MSAKESILLEAIQGGMLHVNVKGKKGIKRDSKLDVCPSYSHFSAFYLDGISLSTALL